MVSPAFKGAHQQVGHTTLPSPQAGIWPCRSPLFRSNRFSCKNRLQPSWWRRLLRCRFQVVALPACILRELRFAINSRLCLVLFCAIAVMPVNVPGPVFSAVVIIDGERHALNQRKSCFLPTFHTGRMRRRLSWVTIWWCHATVEGNSSNTRLAVRLPVSRRQISTSGRACASATSCCCARRRKLPEEIKTP